MTTKVLTVSEPAGYSLKSTYSRLDIEPGVSIGGYGVVLNFAGSVVNYSTIAPTTTGDSGIYLKLGGYAFNGGPLSGYEGVKVGAGATAATTINNDGDLRAESAGVDLLSSATVKNSNTIYGFYGGVVGTGGAVIVTVTNMSGGVIDCDFVGFGVEAPDGTIVNYGTIESNFDGAGVLLGKGKITNGSNTSRTALLEGEEGGVITSGAGASVVNYATIRGFFYAAVALDGGSLTNGGGADDTALITTNGETITAVSVSAAGTVNNFGFIDGPGSVSGAYGIYFSDGGVLTNGSAGSHAALIEAYGGVKFDGATGTVSNFATIEGLSTDSGASVYLRDGGQVTNGSGQDHAALIAGYNGVFFGAAGTLTNLGTINGTNAGAQLDFGGVVKNGAATDTTALIEGYVGVIALASVIVTNFATITSSADDAGGVVSTVGGTVINGSGGDTAALLVGYSGIEFDTGKVAGDAGRVVNYATITGEGGAGVLAYGGLSLTNGGGVNHTARIEGVSGVSVLGGVGTVANFGSIVAGGNGDFGVYLVGGGKVTNGSVNNFAALIEGYSGVRLGAGAAATNFGTILGAGDAAGAGASLIGSASLTNGSAAHPGAIVRGYTGVSVASDGKVDTFGTIIGEGGTAVQFLSSSGQLKVESGSVFVGAVNGDGGYLDLASGVGTVTSLLSSAGDVTESGITAGAMTFNDFGALRIGTSTTATDAGGGTIAAGQTLVIAGALTTTGVITIAGTGNFGGTLSGTGTLALTGGTTTLNTGTDLTIAKVTETGAATAAAFAATSLTVADVWTQTAGTVSAATGDKVDFTGTGDTFSGTLSGAGTIGFTGGADALSGATLSATAVSIDGAAVTLSGVLDVTDTVLVISPDVIVAAAGASLTGGGTISLSNSTVNVIKGASASAALTVVSGRIVGAGQLGDGEMALTNDAGGIIDGYLSDALTINLGANTLTNAGLIENAGAGGTTITGAVDNTGTLQATKGTLTVGGAVTGTGTARIAGGTIDFASTFTENVAFTTAGGVLELADAATYTGTITGFAKTSITSLDLTDIAFTGATVSYSGTTTSGVLTIKSGAHTAKINLTGDYLTSTFTLSMDASGGTIVTDPMAPATKPPITTLPLVAAMAGFGGASGGAHALTAETAHMPAIALAAPGVATA